VRLDRTVLLGLAAAVAGPWLATPATAQDCGVLPSIHLLKTEQLTVRTARGPVKLKTEIARSTAEQERGLMCRKTVPNDHAMLYPFTPPQQVAFWMKNTLAPLDVLFVDQGGRIFRIVRKAPPLSLDPIPSNGETAGVIEIGGGQSDALGIRPGDTVVSKALSHG